MIPDPLAGVSPQTQQGERTSANPAEDAREQRHDSLPARYPVELAAGSVVVERYHWEKANGRRGVQWLAQVVDRHGNLTLYKVCKTRTEALMEALNRG